jgi:hypothetical protein
MFGFASTLLATWEANAVYVTSSATSAKSSIRPTNSSARTLGISLPNGGTAGLFWNYVIAAIGFAFVYVSIAELSSM